MVFMTFPNRLISGKAFMQHLLAVSPKKLLILKTKGMEKSHMLLLKDGKLFQRIGALAGQSSSEHLMMLKSYRQDSFL